MSDLAATLVVQERRIDGYGWRLRVRWNEDEASMVIETDEREGFSSTTVVALDLRELALLSEWLELARRTISEG
jgi:hypothetical protein